MSTKSKGDEYEDFIANIYQALHSNEDVRNIHIEQKKKIKNRNGIDREIDLYWEFELSGQIFRVAVECRNYNSTIKIEQVEAFAKKMQDLNISKGIMATKIGYQNGAIKTAEKEGISLLVIRKPIDSDWDGLLTGVHLHLEFIHAPTITSFNVKVDKTWAEQERPDLLMGQGKIEALPTEITIEDIRTKTVITLENFYRKLPVSEPGDFIHTENFDDTFLAWNGNRIKISSFEIGYKAHKSEQQTMIIDFKSYVIAFMEYIQSEKKKIAIMYNGKTKSWDSST